MAAHHPPALSINFRTSASNLTRRFLLRTTSKTVPPSPVRPAIVRTLDIKTGLSLKMLLYRQMVAFPPTPVQSISTMRAMDMLDMVSVSCASGLKGSNPRTRLSFEALTRVLYSESGCAGVKELRVVANEWARTWRGRDCSSPTVMVG